jgi:hypothetical protein
MPNLKYAQLTAWNLLNPNSTFTRHENHDHAIISSVSPTLVVPMPPANLYSVYAYVVTPLYNKAAATSSDPLNAGPACWKQGQANFIKQYSKKYINRTLYGADAMQVQHPLGAAIVDPCCNTLKNEYYWHVAPLPTATPLPKA